MTSFDKKCTILWLSSGLSPNLASAQCTSSSSLGRDGVPGKSLIPLIAHGLPMSMLSGPMSGLNALRAENSSQLHQLIEDLGIQLSIRPQSPAVFDRVLQDVLANPANDPKTSATLQESPSI